MSSVGNKLKSWGPSGDPLAFKPIAGGGKYISQMVGASIKNGVVHHELIVGAGYKKEDVCHFLKVLKKKYKDVKFAVFLDNASIHTSDHTRLFAYDLGIPLIFNIPYCPQYNGLENLWIHTKVEYKRRVTKCIYQSLKWDNEDLVTEIF